METIQDIKGKLLKQQEQFKQRLELTTEDESYLKEGRIEADHLGVQVLHDEMQILTELTKKHSQNLLSQIQQSLSRLDEGLYGICTKCNKQIEAERLAILPMTTFCKGCK